MYVYLFIETDRKGNYSRQREFVFGSKMMSKEEEKDYAMSADAGFFSSSSK